MVSEPAAISVALCTFNGSRFLQDQLQSIKSQVRPPSELVACDDRSTDDTVDILRRFADDAGFPVRIFANTRNLGSTRNFDQAISLCRGDVIALSDQDDVWEPEKLVEIGTSFDSRPGLGMVFSDAAVVGAGGEDLGYSVWESRAIPVTENVRVRIAEGGLFPILLKSNIVTGATMAFRAPLRSLVLPIPPNWVHDAWIALLVSARCDVVALPRRLVKYRQHEAQQIGGRWLSLRQQMRWAASIGPSSFEQAIRNIDAAIDRLESQSNEKTAGSLAGLREKRRHFAARLEMRRKKAARWWRGPREFLTGRYGRYDLGWRSLAQDLFLAGTPKRSPESSPPLWGAIAEPPGRPREPRTTDQLPLD